MARQVCTLAARLSRHRGRDGRVTGLRAAAQAIGQDRLTEADDICAALMRDEEPIVREWAAWAAGRLRAPSLWPVIEERSLIEDCHDVRVYLIDTACRVTPGRGVTTDDSKEKVRSVLRVVSRWTNEDESLTECVSKTITAFLGREEAVQFVR